MTEKIIPESISRRCSVFLTPAPADFAYLAGVIRELSSKFDVTPFEPHVTVYSGEFPDPALLVKGLVEGVAGIPPLNLRVRGIGCTPEYFRTLFVEFEEDRQLRLLHDRIKAGCGVDTGYALFPHLSLLYAELPLREKEALARRTAIDRATIRFDGVKVVTPQNAAAGWRDTLRWKTLWRERLGGEPAGSPLRAVIFDFGGVLAEEGFREGLAAIAGRQGLDPERLIRHGTDAVYDSGYVIGRGSEADFWALMRERTGISGDDAELSTEILMRFVIRPRMLAAVRRLRGMGIVTAVLSDQTDWLERLDARDRFFGEFDRVFNSYRLGKGKRDPSVFADAVALLGIAPHEALFVDDLPANVERARGEGVRGMLFTDEERFLTELERLLADIRPPADGR